MSFTQLLAEIPTLTRLERRELVLRLVEMDSTEAELDDMAVCEQSATLGFAILDSMEAEDMAR
jgi:uncharacterized protein Smg (DUF494 family)